MRKKAPYVIFTFHTTADAIGFETYCQESEIPGRMIPVPREISAGCGLAYRIPEEQYPEYDAKLKAAGVEIEGIAHLTL